MDFFFQIPNHTDHDCSLTIISCPYEKMGCEAKVCMLMKVAACPHHFAAARRDVIFLFLSSCNNLFTVLYFLVLLFGR